MASHEGLSQPAAGRLYDRITWLYARLSDVGGQTKTQALTWRAVRPGERVLEVGCGAGHDLRRWAAAVGPRGLAVGVDLAYALLRLARQRAAASLVQAKATRLPWPAEVFDAVYGAYVLDLLPHEALVPALREWRRVVRPAGRAVMVTMTWGTESFSRVVMGLWSAVYRLSPPAICAGCRPLSVAPAAREAGWHIRQRKVLIE
ncbi:MAG TPA: methyltransferase domain-containing protein [Anaerolineae bacterium]|nr:methyltransferase domain-containing protein [Anaerolineae bacterium]